MFTFNRSLIYLQRLLFYQEHKVNFDVCSLRLHNRVEEKWGCIRHPGGGLAVPIISKGKLVLLKQYCFAVERQLLKFPAGILESDKEALETIKREIQEETELLC